MRRLLIAALLVAGLPLTASAEECQTAELTGGKITSRPVVAEDTTIRFDVVGSFLNVYIGAENDLVDTSLTSVEIPEDATGVTVCGDGSVAFTHSEVAPAPVVAAPICDCDPSEYERFVDNDYLYGPR